MALSSMLLKKASVIYLVIILFFWIVTLSFLSTSVRTISDSTNQTNLRFDKNNDEPVAIVVGLPKSGTTSIYQYFVCNDYQTTHYCCCGSDSSEYPCKNGRQMSEQLYDNLMAGRPLLQALGSFPTTTTSKGVVHAQLDGELFHNKKEPYFVPQHYYLDELHSAAPHATWILPLRSAEGWKQSVERWLDMGDRLRQSYEYHYPNLIKEEWNLVDFYQQHTDAIRRACKRYGRKCVEVPVTDTAGTVLEKAFPGTKASCWGRHNAGPFFQTIPNP